MDLNFGINGSFGIAAARPITISSSTPIGIVATADKGDFGLMKFNNADDGLKYIKDKLIKAGTLEAIFTGISLQAVNCPLVVHVSLHDEDEAVNKTNILAALDELKKSDPITGINLKNGLVIAPFYSEDVEVAKKIKYVWTKLWTTRIVHNFSEDDVGIKKKKKISQLVL